MKKLFRGRVRLILLLAVLLAAATALTAALSGTAWGSRTVQAVLTPFRSGFSALTRQAERYYNYLFNYESLSAENDYLRRQISSMENEVRTADSLQRENERLKELLGLQEEHEDYRFLGYVEDAGFDETGVAKYAMLRPAADLEDLEQVFVITDYVSE